MSESVLVLGAHPDDEVLGLGATLARHIARGDAVCVALIADGNPIRYDEELARHAHQCAREAASRLGVTEVRFAGMGDQRLDTLGIVDVTQWIEGVVRDVRPSTIYTHHRGDANYDHRVVFEATMAAVRPYNAPFVERVLCYETPSSSEWAQALPEHFFMPNVYVDITDHLETKLNAIAAYHLELRPYPHPRSIEALRIRAAHWGSVIGVRAAEPFSLVREIER